MPLLDHFHAPLKRERHWQGFHSYWASAIVEQLNAAQLPPGYVAEPHVKIGMAIEIDAATHETEHVELAGQNGGVATAVYAPPRPALTLPVDFSTLETFEIRIHSEDGGLKLVAAIELISPGNKDRPEHRAAFVRKCATYLQEGIGLIVVDIVTDRSANLHAALVHELAGDAAGELGNQEELYAASYHARFLQAGDRVAIWPEPLAIGQALPTLPLWLSDVLAVPVDLERSYVSACKALRIRV